MSDLIVFNRVFCFDLISKGYQAPRDSCAEISQFFGLVVLTVYDFRLCVSVFSLLLLLFCSISIF